MQNTPFQSLTTEPQSEIILENHDAPVHIKIQSNISYKCEFVDSAGFYDTVVEYAGTNSLMMLAPFQGTYISPDADLYLGTSGALEFTGAFYAKRIEVHPDAVVTHAPVELVSESCFDGVQNQDEDGVDCGGVCPPCTGCAPVTHEAETMYHSTGNGVPDGWNISQNGYISTDHDFDSGTVTLRVTARGESAFGVWPHMVISVGGATIGDTSVTSADYQEYEFTVPVTSGVQEIQIIYDNDFSWWYFDRNLIVDNLIVDNC